MLLSSFVLFILLFAITAYVSLSIHSSLLAVGSLQGNWQMATIGAIISFVLTVAISLRNPLFGVDTLTYAGIFNSYCAEESLSNLETSFLYSVRTINVLMLGLCDSRYLSFSWVAFIVIGLFAMRAEFSEKTIYISMFLTSMVGIELTTNALRQGFSIVLLIAALSYYKYNNPLAAILVILSVALHTSSALIILFFFLCSLKMRAFLISVCILSFLIISAVKSGTTLLIASQFVYEIQKYLEHDADEIAIRMLAFACVLSVAIVPVILSSSARLALWKSRNYSIAIKMLLVCIPFLYLPYFGYRLIYGTFPVVLWLVMTRLFQSGKFTLGIFMSLTFANLAILWIWSAGSSYMRSIVFLS
jgi:EpsG family